VLHKSKRTIGRVFLQKVSLFYQWTTEMKTYSNLRSIL